MAPLFAARFGAALQARLLHAGASTPDIIATYVATIRALHTVDPTGDQRRAPAPAPARGRGRAPLRGC